MISFDGLDPIVLRFSDVEQGYAVPRSEEHRRVREVGQKALEGIELTFRESHPLDFDPMFGRQLVQRFKRNHYESVFYVEEWLLKRAIVHRVDQLFAGVERKTEQSAERIAGSCYHCYNNIFRVVMDSLLEEVNQKYGFEMVLPREYLVPLPDQESLLPDFLQYVVFAEKVAFLQDQEAVDTIQKMPLETQKHYIDYLASWIHKSGYLDGHFRNIGLSKTETMLLHNTPVPKFVVIDTEPFGLITEEKDHPPLSQLAPDVFRERLTRAEAAYIGLLKLQEELADKQFSPEIQRIAAGWVEQAKRAVSLEKAPEPAPKKRWLRFLRKPPRA